MARGYPPSGWLGRRKGPSQSGSITSHVLMLLTGSLIGAALAWWWFVAAPAVERSDVSPITGAGGPNTGARGASLAETLAPVLEISVVRRDGSSERSTGIAVRRTDGQSGVLVALEALIDAQAVVITLGAGNALGLGEVLAIAPQAGLALLGATRPLRFENALAAADDSALHLGRQFDLLGRGGQRTAGWIDSAAQRNPTGAYWYALSEQVQAIAAPAALVDASGALLGVAVPYPEQVPPAATGAPARAALDLQALAPLFQGASPAAAPLREFVDAFFSTDDTGRLIHTRHAAERGDWLRVIRAGSDLANLGYPIGDAARPLLEEAFQVSVADALAGNGGTRLARQLLDRAATLLGWSASRRLLAARVARSEGDVDGALAQL
ncbi:MAG: hypothetical protein AAFX85_06590, partial [Pseudomonadota bacterium]